MLGRVFGSPIQGLGTWCEKHPAFSPAKKPQSQGAFSPGPSLHSPQSSFSALSRAVEGSLSTTTVRLSPACSRIPQKRVPHSSRGILRDEWVPLCRRPERSPKGEATELLPSLLLLHLFFTIFRPEITRQVPNPPNPLPTNKIRVAF